MSKLVGRHTFKVGADYRFIGLDFQSFSEASGDFAFDRFYTSSTRWPTTPPPATRFASMLLGLPVGQTRAGQHGQPLEPVQRHTRYFGATPRTTSRRAEAHLNYGVRLEHETGLLEKNDGFAVAFDRTLNPGGALGNLVVTGQPMRGGLIYAGQNGANDTRAIRRR